MTDVWDLAAYVEAHPENLEQRWRLAKKLYTTFEYRLALEHLLVLKNEWGPRENVIRYTAATYFRLGRYEEAIREMRAALDRFPDDIGLNEQLARTLVVADHKEAALAQWEKIAKLRPNHPAAGKAIDRLRRAIDKETEEENKIERAKAGADFDHADSLLTTDEMACPSCGEKNSAEFRRCWKCHAPLSPVESPPESRAKVTATSPARVRYPLLTGISIAALLALGVFLTLNAFFRHRGGGSEAAMESVLGLLEWELLWTRVVAGVALLIVWPLAWRAGAWIANIEAKVYNDALYQYGALLALGTYAMMWLPWRWLGAAAVAPVAVSVVIAFLALQLRPLEAARLWAIQIAAAAVVFAGIVMAMEGPGILTTAPQIASYVASKNVAAPYSSVLSAPGDIRVVFKSTGSHWLDKKGSRFRLTLEPADGSGDIFVDTLLDGKSLSFERVGRGVSSTGLSSVIPGKTYVFRVQSNAPVPVSFTVRSLLPVTVELAPYRAASGGS